MLIQEEDLLVVEPDKANEVSSSFSRKPPLYVELGLVNYSEMISFPDKVGQFRLRSSLDEVITSGRT